MVIVEDHKFLTLQFSLWKRYPFWDLPQYDNDGEDDDVDGDDEEDHGDDEHDDDDKKRHLQPSLSRSPSGNSQCRSRSDQARQLCPDLKEDEDKEKGEDGEDDKFKWERLEAVQDAVCHTLSCSYIPCSDTSDSTVDLGRRPH